MKVLYLYAGPRKKLYADFLKGVQPDTPLVGLNHLDKFGIKAEFFENFFTETFRKISFNFTQLPALLVAWKYDAIFSGSGLLALFLAKYVLRFSRPKWFIYNTYLSNLLKRNGGGLKAWFVRKAISSADGIICPSSAQKDFLEKEGFDAKKLFFIPYGVDREFYRSKISLKNTDLVDRYITSAGRDIGRDYKTLLSAVRDTNISTIIGALPRNFKESENLPKNVSVSYFTPLELLRIMSQSSFVVIPTIDEEKMVGSDCSGQYVLLESMMLGKAIITTNRNTLSDYFSDGKNGLTVPPENPKALRNAIIYLWDHPGEADKMGEFNAELAASSFSTIRFAEEFSAVLKKVVGEKR